MHKPQIKKQSILLHMVSANVSNPNPYRDFLVIFTPEETALSHTMATATLKSFYNKAVEVID